MLFSVTKKLPINLFICFLQPNKSGGISRLEDSDQCPESARNVALRYTALVKNTHGKLGARLADRLRCYNASGKALFNRRLRHKIIAITFKTYLLLRASAENGRHDRDRRNARLRNCLKCRTINYTPTPNEDLPLTVTDILHRIPQIDSLF